MSFLSKNFTDCQYQELWCYPSKLWLCFKICSVTNECLDGVNLILFLCSFNLVLNCFLVWHTYDASQSEQLILYTTLLFESTFLSLSALMKLLSLLIYCLYCYYRDPHVIQFIIKEAF